MNLIRGTLDVLILKTLSWGRLHGYAIANAIHCLTGDALLVEEGALYPALYRMETRRWVEAEWGLSDNNRRAKYYQLTALGRSQLQSELKTWRDYSAAVGKVLNANRAPLAQKS